MCIREPLECALRRFTHRAFAILRVLAAGICIDRIPSHLVFLENDGHLFLLTRNQANPFLMFSISNPKRRKIIQTQLVKVPNKCLSYIIQDPAMSMGS